MNYLSKNILSEFYFKYLKLFFYIFNLYNNDRYKRNKILDINDPYLFINQEYFIRTNEKFNFIKTKYKLHKIKDLLSENNILILQYLIQHQITHDVWELIHSLKY